MTPGLAIHQATPGPVPPLPGVPGASSPLSPLEPRTSHTSRPSGDKEDYFSGTIGPADAGVKAAGTPAAPAAPEADEKIKDKGKDKAGDGAKSPSTPFGKKFRMTFGTKKLGRSPSQTTQEKPVVTDEKAEESESSSSHEKEVEDSFYGVIQMIRNEYEKQLADSPDKIVETRLTPSLPSETPVLKLPPKTKVIIQEETSGSVANVYEGTVESVGTDADIIEQKGPMWLGQVLLQNQATFKEPVKISFVLQPIGDLPPVTSADGNNRLNANRMLRVRKILSYVAERIEQLPDEPEEDALKPEEYLELYCNEQVGSPRLTTLCNSPAY
jgi:WD repeat-containing protein 48